MAGTVRRTGSDGRRSRGETARESLGIEGPPGRDAGHCFGTLDRREAARGSVGRGIGAIVRGAAFINRMIPYG